MMTTVTGTKVQGTRWDKAGQQELDEELPDGATAIPPFLEREE
jgi:hypothetical protein